MGPSLGFVTDVSFFSVGLCYILWSVLLHHWICIAPLLELIAHFEVVLRQCFSILKVKTSVKLLQSYPTVVKLINLVE